MKDKEYHVANFATFVSKLLLFPLQKWMNLISDRLSTASIKYLNWPSPVFGRFQNGCNKVVIEPRVVQFWSEIILVISYRTRAERSFDFEITRMISAQIALHSVQLPLWIIAPGLSFRIWLYLEISRFCCINTDIYDFSLHKVLTHFQALAFSKPTWSNKTNFKLSIKHFWRMFRRDSCHH